MRSFMSCRAGARGALVLSALSLSFLGTARAIAQGPPDIVWSHGVNPYVKRCGWMPDSQRYITAGPTLRLHNRDGSISRTYPISCDDASASPDGAYFAVSGSGFVKKVRVSDGQVLWTFPINASYRAQVIYSPNGSSIAVLQYSGGRLLRASDGVELTNLGLSAAFNPAGTIIATDRGVIDFIQTVDGSLDHSINFKGDPRCFSPNGTRVVISVPNGQTGTRSAHIREVTSGQLWQSIAAGSFNFAYSADGSQLFGWDWTSRDGGPTGTYQHGYLDRWDMASYQRTRLVTSPETAGAIQTSLSPDATAFLVTGERSDNQVTFYAAHVQFAEIYDPATGLVVANAQGPGSHVSAVAFSGDLRLIALGTSDGHVWLRNRADGAYVATIHFHSQIARIEFSADSSLLAVCSSGGGIVRVYKMSDLSEYLAVNYPNPSNPAAASYITDTAFSPDGKTLAIACNYPHNKLDFYDLPSKTLTTTWSNGQAYAAVAYSLDGKYLAFLRGGGVAVIDRKTNAVKWSTSNAGSLLALSPNGTYIATASGSEIYLRNLVTGALIKQMTDHTERVNDLAFSPDSGTLMSGSRDATLRFWNTANGALTRTYTDETGGPISDLDGVTGVAYPCDGYEFAYVTGAASVTMARNPFYRAPTVSTLVLNPVSVFGSAPSTGSVTLSWCAPPGGLTVILGKAAALAGATIPSSLLIEEGMRSGTFQIQTVPVTVNQTGAISAKLGAVTKTASFTIKAPALSKVTVAPTTVNGGASATGTVTLTAPPGAGTGGIVVTLSSNSAAATVPASVTVPEGSTTATFPITTTGVAANTTAVITASYNAVNKTANLVVKAAALSTLKLLPTSVRGGLANSTGTVTLTAVAPAGGLTVSLSSDKSAAQVPPSLVVLEGQSTATFTVTTSTVGVKTAARITATLGSVVRAVTLTLTP